MLSQTIGQATLSISLIIYIVQYVPQLIHNSLSNKTSQISLNTQLLIVIAASCDLAYGFGYNLQWQYKLVSILGLIYLIIQQMQIISQNSTGLLTRIYTILAFILIITSVTYTIYNIKNDYILDTIGYIETSCYIVYWLPQIIKNFITKQADGFSKVFLIITLIGAMLDLLSAIFLHWPVPSILMPINTLILVMIIIMQSRVYNRK